MSRFLLAGLFAAALVASAGLPGPAQDKDKAKAKKERPPKVAVDDPAKLAGDKDFAIQGEYFGEVTSSGSQGKAGAHVIAKGDGNFEVRFYKGGLPGDGWDQKETPSGTGKRDGDNILLSSGPDKSIGSISGGVLTLDNPEVKGTLRKIERKSPTLGARPPTGATVLFAGPEDIAKWDGAKLAELSDGKFLAASGLRSKDTFKNFQLHLEFRTPWMPKESGQQRGNSGVYLQDRYELQVLDSFGLKGLNNECGGIYTVAEPKVNMCYPPMAWQTYDIDFTAAEFDAAGKKTRPAKVTIKHNGVVIHDNLEPKSNTPGGKFKTEVPEPGSLYLQNHGDPVVFNNIWVVVK